MRKRRFTEEQIIQVLKAAEAGEKGTDLCRKHGISEQTLYRWKAKYGGMEVNEARRLKQLQDENRRLKHAVADLTLETQALRAALSKNGEARGPARGGCSGKSLGSVRCVPLPWQASIGRPTAIAVD
jgi:putative transposase